MKLLQLNVTANWGSTGKIAEGIGQAAMARGWESYIAYGRYMNPSQSQLIKVGNKFDVYAHYARNRFLDGEGLGSKSATKEFVRKVEELSPDIIHLHNIHDHWLNYPVLFDYLASVDIPVVWTFHDCWAFTGGCYHFEDAGCTAWKENGCSVACPLGHHRASKNFALRKKLYSAIGSRMHIVGVSDWLKRYASESMLGATGVNFHVINNGIDTDKLFKPGTSSKTRSIIGVSNIWPEYKGLSDFVKLRDILPADVAITLVGLSEKQIASLPAGIKGIMRTNSAQELVELYQQASVFVNPTYNDSFPTVNLEALACGTPVVTYRTGGSPEAVDESTGIVIDKGDVNGLADAIMKVIDNPSAFTPEACRRRAVEKFNKDVQFNKYIDLYESLTKRI